MIEKTFTNEYGKKITIFCQAYNLQLKEKNAIYPHVRMGITSDDSNSTWDITREEAKQLISALHKIINS